MVEGGAHLSLDAAALLARNCVAGPRWELGTDRPAAVANDELQWHMPSVSESAMAREADWHRECESESTFQIKCALL